MNEALNEYHRGFLESKDRRFAKAGMSGVLQKAIHAAYPELIKNFSPEECVDITFEAFRELMDSKIRENTLLWLKELKQSPEANV